MDGMDGKGAERVTRYGECAHWMWSGHFKGRFCSRHNHIAESPRGGCTWGEPKGGGR